jgi:FSR family fosmidomycin resistance protein-like MFS transporter
MAVKSPRAISWPAATLVAGHAIDDLYQGAVPALVTFLVAERHYGYVAASGIVLAATLLSSVVQPVFGLLTDRWAMPWLVPLGMTMAGSGVGLSGLAEWYPLTWLSIALSGLGVAAYHPEAARLARIVTGGSHIGMSWFSVGGSIGFALGPILTTAVVGTAGISGSPLLIVPAVAGGLITAAMLRRIRLAAVPGPQQANRVAARRDEWPQFARLTTLVMARSIVFFGLGAFVSLHVQDRLDAGPVAGNAALVVLFGVGVAGTLLGGVLATRWGRLPTVRRASVAAVPALAGLVFVPGPVIYLFVAAVAITIYVPFSLFVTLGQDYLPGRIGTASGVTLGLAVSVGGVAAPALGAIAEATTLPTALALLITLPVLSWLVVRGMTEPGQAAVEMASGMAGRSGVRD